MKQMSSKWSMAWESTAARERGWRLSACHVRKKLPRGLELGRSSLAVTCSDVSRAEETKAQERCSLRVLSQLPILLGGARRGSARAEEKGLPRSVLLRPGAAGVWTLGWTVQILFT